MKNIASPHHHRSTRSVSLASFTPLIRPFSGFHSVASGVRSKLRSTQLQSLCADGTAELQSVHCTNGTVPDNVAQRNVRRPECERDERRGGVAVAARCDCRAQVNTRYSNQLQRTYTPSPHIFSINIIDFAFHSALSVEPSTECDTYEIFLCSVPLV